MKDSTQLAIASTLFTGFLTAVAFIVYHTMTYGIWMSF